MVFRNLVAFVYVLCASTAILPVETSARAGGSAIGRGLMFRGAVARLPVSIGRGRSFVTPHAAVTHVHAAPTRRFRRAFGARLPNNGIGVYYGPSYDPGDLTGAASTSTMPVAGNEIAVLSRHCYSETIVVPSEAGGERSITVTRCRSE